MAVEFDSGRSVFVTLRDGLKMHVRIWGDEASGETPILCLPGLSRNSRDFAGIAAHLVKNARTKRTIYALDFRGRGLSDSDKDWTNYNLMTELDDVLNALTALGIEHAIIIGTSRGGMITMMMAAARPGAIKGVILNDIGPVIEGDGLTQIRLYLKNAKTPRNMDEALRLQKSIMGKTFPALSDEDWAFECWSRFREIGGKLKADFDPALVKTLTSIDLSQRLPTMWPQFAGLRGVPMMVVRGENSNLLSQKTADAMRKYHPDCEIVTAGGQGHAPMLHARDLTAPVMQFVDQFR